jgi:hypothetical protein
VICLRNHHKGAVDAHTAIVVAAIVPTAVIACDAKARLEPSDQMIHVHRIGLNRKSSSNRSSGDGGGGK